LSRLQPDLQPSARAADPAEHGAGRTRAALGALSAGTGGAWAVSLAGIGLAFATQLVLARLLPAAEFGALFYTFAWAEVLGMIAPLGYDKLLIRELARQRHAGHWGLAHGILRCAARWTSLGVLVAVAVALGFGLSLRGQLDPALIPVFWMTALLVPVRAWVNLRHGALLGLSRPVAGLMATSVTYSLAFLVLVGLARLLAPERLDAFVAACAALLAWLVSLALADAQTRARMAEGARAPAEFRAREWIREALPMMLIVGMALLTLKADLILLGALRGAEEAGVYVTAASLAHLVRLGIVAVNPALAPLAVNAQASGSERELEAVARSATRLAFVPALVCAAALLVFGRWALALFQPEFVAGYGALVILALGFLVVSTMGPVETILLMKNQQRLAAASAVGACVLNLTLNATLIPMLGMRGAALATALSMIAWAVAMSLAVRRRLGLRMSIFARAGS
jgi:O-antigen/teichoic acid export membrane protein